MKQSSNDNPHSMHLLLTAGGLAVLYLLSRLLWRDNVIPVAGLVLAAAGLLAPNGIMHTIRGRRAQPVVARSKWF